MSRLISNVVTGLLLILIIAPGIAAQSTPTSGSDAMYDAGETEYMNEDGLFVILSFYDIPPEVGEEEAMSAFADGFLNNRIPDTELVGELDAPEHCRMFKNITYSFEWFMILCTGDGTLMGAMSQDESTVRYIADRFLNGEESLLPPGFKEGSAQTPRSELFDNSTPESTNATDPELTRVSPVASPTPDSASPPSTGAEYAEATTQYRDADGHWVAISVLENPEESEDWYLQFLEERIESNPDYEAVDNPPVGCVMFTMSPTPPITYVIGCSNHEYMLTLTGDSPDILRDIAERFHAGQPDLAPSGFEIIDSSTPESSIDSSPEQTTPASGKSQSDTSMEYAESSEVYIDASGNKVLIAVHENPGESGSWYLQSVEEGIGSSEGYESMDDPPDGCVMFTLVSSDPTRFVIECANDEYILSLLGEDPEILREIVNRFHSGEPELALPGFEIMD